MKDDFNQGIKWYFNFLGKLVTTMFGKGNNIVMFFIHFGLIIISILLVIELFNYDNLNYSKIYLYIMLIISTKLSWVIQLLK